MEQNVQHIIDPTIAGKKTFFISPSEDMVSRSYFQSYLSHGYECYLINDEPSFPLSRKINAIISVFPNSLLVFDATSSSLDINLESYIQSLQEVHGDTVTIGVIYSENCTPEQKEHFASFYKNTAKITGGLLELEPNNPNNFESITNFLEQNKVGGRRKTVRALCPQGSNVTFSYEDQTYSSPLIDISMSHFCTDITMHGIKIPIYKCIENASFKIGDFTFSSDVVIILRRTETEKARCVFMFIRHDEKPGLEGDLEAQLSSKIYSMIEEECFTSLKNRVSSY